MHDEACALRPLHRNRPPSAWASGSSAHRTDRALLRTSSPLLLLEHDTLAPVTVLAENLIDLLTVAMVEVQLDPVVEVNGDLVHESSLDSADEYGDRDDNADEYHQRRLATPRIAVAHRAFDKPVARLEAATSATKRTEYLTVFHLSTSMKCTRMSYT